MHVSIIHPETIAVKDDEVLEKQVHLLFNIKNELY